MCVLKLIVRLVYFLLRDPEVVNWGREKAP